MQLTLSIAISILLIFPELTPATDNKRALNRKKKWNSKSLSKWFSKSKWSSESKSKSKNPQNEHEIFEVQEIEINVICGTLEEIKEDFEAAILDFFRAEFDDCDSDRDVQTVNLVQWEEALKCTEDEYRFLEEGGRELRQKRNKSKARINKRSRCRRCDDRRLVGEYFQDNKKEGFVLNAAGRDLGYKGKKGKVKSRECSADLAKELSENGFRGVRKAETVSISKADCSSKSKDCTATGKS